MASIYTQIDQNKRGTLLIIAAFIGVIAAIGWFLGEFYFEGSGLFFIGIALIFSSVSGFVSYYNSDKMVLAISGAHEVAPTENEYLHNLVENISIASGLPKPKVFIIEDTALNAFATGRDPEHGVVCVTTGIVNTLEKRELEGVIAHEMSHIGNYDTRFMTIVSILVGSIALIADFFTRGMFYGGGRKRGSGGGILMLIGVVLIILSPIFATLIKLALSRQREYLADATSAMITRYPKGLADALLKLGTDVEVLEAANGATAHLYISNPLKGGHGGLMSSLFSTHPPIEDRIARLLQM